MKNKALKTVNPVGNVIAMPSTQRGFASSAKSEWLFCTSETFLTRFGLIVHVLTAFVCVGFLIALIAIPLVQRYTHLACCSAVESLAGMTDRAVQSYSISRNWKIIAMFSIEFALMTNAIGFANATSGPLCVSTTLTDHCRTAHHTTAVDIEKVGGGFGKRPCAAVITFVQNIPA
jgi:hypothetical protein